ncbi:FliH/SctL family protein [Bdellovibrionota bacterium FG-2]
MAKFTQSDFKVQPEFKDPSGTRVFKPEVIKAPQVQEFEFGKLTKKGDGEYSSVRAKYGPLAATDPEKKDGAQRERRFSLSPLAKAPLAIDEEERRVIDSRVKEGITALENEAKERGHQDGYLAGLEEGKVEALSQFRQEAIERLLRFESFVDEAEAAKDKIYQANERFLMELVFRIAKMVILRELSTDKEYIGRLARELIERTGIRENISIRVHPDDLKNIVGLKEGLEAKLGALKNLNVEGSSQVREGGCTIETEWNALDATLETQLESLRTSLLGDASQGVKA